MSTVKAYHIKTTADRCNVESLELFKSLKSFKSLESIESLKSFESIESFV